ncbi:hypothetical protein HG531_006245 [Fusarium graminearum]|nr:hypothetical protein HG531_006245 [Fusarium graminearum]
MTDNGRLWGIQCLTALAAAALALIVDVDAARCSLVDVDVALGGDLEERDAQLVGEGLALLGGNDALLLPVALVAD